MSRQLKKISKPKSKRWRKARPPMSINNRVPEPSFPAASDTPVNEFSVNSGSGRVQSGVTLFPTTAERITAERQPIYGHPALNYIRVAMMLNGLFANKLIAPLTAEEAILAMQVIKLARLEQTPDHPDSLDDIEGYNRCLRQTNKVRTGGNVDMEAAGIRLGTLAMRHIL